MLEPVFRCQDRRAPPKRVRPNLVRLKGELDAGNGIDGMSFGLFHLHSANCRSLIGVEVVRGPVVREAQRAIQLRGVEARVPADVESGQEPTGGDGLVPLIAVVDDIGSRGVSPLSAVGFHEVSDSTYWQAWRGLAVGGSAGRADVDAVGTGRRAIAVAGRRRRRRRSSWVFSAWVLQIGRAHV